MPACSALIAPASQHTGSTFADQSQCTVTILVHNDIRHILDTLYSSGDQYRWGIQFGQI